MYQYKEAAPGRYFLSIDNHQGIVAALAAFCAEKQVASGVVSGIGAVSEATFRFLDPATRQYVDRTFAEQMEIASLVGNISRKDGKPYIHVHATCGRRDYTCIGGHLLEATLNGACELFVETFPAEVGRRPDPETGLNLYVF